MNALWQIILQILWRLRPVQALEVNLHDVIQMGLDLFASDDGVDDLAQDASYRRTLAAALFDAHSKLDLLIYLRACEISGTKPVAKRFTPNYAHTHNSAGLMALWRSFHRLIERFDSYERLAHVRASRLKLEPDALPLRLAATLQFTSPALRAVEANNLRLLAVQLASTTSQKWGRWIARPCAQDGGGAPAFARGPPLNSLDCLLPTAECLARSARENAPAWDLHAQRSGHALAVAFQHNDYETAVRKFFNTEIGCYAAVRDNFAKSELGFPPRLKARPPVGVGHNQSPVPLRGRAGTIPCHSAHHHRSQPVRSDYLTERPGESPEHTSTLLRDRRINTVRVLIMAAMHALAPER